GQDHDYLVAGLFFQNLVRGKEYRVIKHGSAAALVTSATATLRILVVGIVVAALRKLRRLQALQPRMQFFPGRGYILIEHYFAIKVNQKCLVFVRPEHLIEKAGTRVSFFAESPPLVRAGVQHQAYNKRLLAFGSEIADVLKASIFLKHEI